MSDHDYFTPDPLPSQGKSRRRRLPLAAIEKIKQQQVDDAIVKQAKTPSTTSAQAALMREDRTQRCYHCRQPQLIDNLKYAKVPGTFTDPEFYCEVCFKTLRLTPVRAGKGTIR